MWGVQFFALLDSEFPVWYPYLGSWLIAILAEVALFMLPNPLKLPKNVFSYSGLVLRLLRIITILLLPTFFLCFRNEHRRYDGIDEECQTLLRKKIGKTSFASESSENTTNCRRRRNGYGSLESQSTQKSSSGNSEDNEAQDGVQCKPQDGSWFTYAKSFSVSPFSSKLRKFFSSPADTK